MAFLGVFLVAGAMSVLVIALLSAFCTGAVLLIAALVLGLLHRRSGKPWQRTAALVCAALGALAAVPPVVIWILLVIVSN